MPFKTNSIVELLRTFVDSRKDDEIKIALGLLEGITDDGRMEIESLMTSYNRLAEALDWRDPKKSAYGLAPMIFMLHFGPIMGYTSVVHIWQFWETAANKLVFLHSSLGAVPSRSRLDSIKREMDQLKVTQFFEDLNTLSFVRLRLQDGSFNETDIVRRLQLSADGQTLNGTHLRKFNQKDGDKIRKTSGLDVVSIHCFQYGKTVNLRIRDAKNHESEAIIEMIKQTPDVYRNTIISFDALNTHENVLNTIVNDALADYFCSIKANQENAFESIKRAFRGRQWKANQSKAIEDSFDTEDGTKTNFTVRTDIQILPVSVLDDENVRKRFPHMQSVVKVVTFKKNLTAKTESYRDTRYFITSLEANLEENPDVAKDFVTLKLRRWGVETGHFHVDKNLNQDRTVFRCKASAFLSAAINKTVMGGILSFVNELKFSSKLGTQFSVGAAMTSSKGKLGTAASILADTVGFDMQQLFHMKDFEATLGTEGSSEQELELARYIYHTEEDAPLDGGNGKDADTAVPHGQQLRKGWSDHTLNRHLGSLKMVSKDNPQYKDQGAVIGNIRLVLTSIDIDCKGAAPCNFQEFMKYYEDENRSIHSADHWCWNKLREFQRHNDADGYAAKCQRKKQISRPTSDKQSA